MALLNETWVAEALAAANVAARAKDHAGVTRALRVLPIEMFIMLYVDPIGETYPDLAAWLPSLPSEEDQRNWAGNVGVYLLHQGAVFVDKMVEVYSRGRSVDFDKVTVLDYGCGWGRLMRILYRYVPAENITGLDPWPPSLERCAETGVWGNFDLIDYIPTALPVAGPYDMVFAYSVFTHISIKAQTAALAAIRKVIAKDGLLALTIRQANYWERAPWPDAEKRAALLKQHQDEGFAFVLHFEGDDARAADYGDTSVTLEFIRKNWTDWKIVDVDWRMIDEFQTYVFLTPA